MRCTCLLSRCVVHLSCSFFWPLPFWQICCSPRCNIGPHTFQLHLLPLLRSPTLEVLFPKSVMTDSSSRHQPLAGDTFYPLADQQPVRFICPASYRPVAISSPQPQYKLALQPPEHSIVGQREISPFWGITTSVLPRSTTTLACLLTTP